MAVSIYISFLLVLASFVITALFYKKIGLFNPLLVFFGVWFLNLVFYEIDVAYIHYFFLPISEEADKWLSISLLSFFVGCLIPFFFKKKSPVAVVIITDRENKWLWYISLILFVLYLGAVAFKYYVIFKTYGNPMAYSTLGKIRMDTQFGHFGFSPLLNFLTLPAYFLIMNLGVLAVIKKSKMALLLGIIAILLSFLNASAAGMRGGFLASFLLFICSLMMAYIASGRAITIRHFFYLILAILCGMLVLTVPMYIRSNGATTFLSAFFLQNYIYFVGTIPSYSYFLAHPWPDHYFGMWTFMGIYQAINSLTALTGFSVFNLNVPTYFAPVVADGPFNSTNYLTYVFSDFGYSGLVVVSFLLGSIANYFFLRVCYYKKIIDIQLAALIFVALILSIRGVITNGVYCWVLILLILLQSLFLGKEKNKDKERSFG